MNLTSLQFLVLHTASCRSDRSVCPMPDVPRLARASFLFNLYILGYITGGDNPKITGAGMKAIQNSRG